MEVRQVILARSVQMIAEGSLGTEYLPDLVQKIKDRYNFIVVPKDEDLLPSDPPKGAEFKHGRLKRSDRSVVVQLFTAFSDGIVVDTNTTTEDSDLFHEDLTEWAKLTLPNVKAVGPRLYLSQLEIHADDPFETSSFAFSKLGDEIRATLSGYGLEVPRYDVSGVTLSFDALGRANPQPGIFMIERRANLPYDRNVWFSQAPLKTEDHIKVLQSLVP